MKILRFLRLVLWDVLRFGLCTAFVLGVVYAMSLGIWWAIERATAREYDAYVHALIGVFVAWTLLIIGPEIWNYLRNRWNITK
jgi:membrane protein YdbS with pleckstrin-like domain